MAKITHHQQTHRPVTQGNDRQLCWHQTSVVLQRAAAMSNSVRYTGHGANTGGLQAHSVGTDYPYMIVGIADRLEAPTEWQVMDCRTSNRSNRFPTYQRAVIEMTSLRTRNLMHS